MIPYSISSVTNKKTNSNIQESTETSLLELTPYKESAQSTIIEKTSWGICSFRKVIIMECALFEMCLYILECALLGICLKWNWPSLECSLFVKWPKWNVLFLECAHFIYYHMYWRDFFHTWNYHKSAHLFPMYWKAQPYRTMSSVHISSTTMRHIRCMFAVTVESLVRLAFFISCKDSVSRYFNVLNQCLALEWNIVSNFC